MGRKERLAALQRLADAKGDVTQIDTLEDSDEEILEDVSYAEAERREQDLLDDNFVVGDHGLGYEETGEDILAIEDEERRMHKKKIKEKDKKKKLKQYRKREKEKKKVKPRLHMFANTKKPQAQASAAQVQRSAEEKSKYLASLLNSDSEDDDMEAELNAASAPAPAAFSAPLADEFDMEIEIPEPVPEEPKKLNPFKSKKEKPKSGAVFSFKKARKTPVFSKKVPATEPSPETLLSVSEPPKKKRKPNHTPVPTKTVPPPKKKLQKSAIKLDDGCFGFYFLDAFEDPWRNPGTVYLFGKRLLSDNSTESCCIVVSGIQRDLYILPKLRIGEDEERYDTKEVLKDLTPTLAQRKCTGYRVRGVPRKFCFENRQEVPEQADYLNVRCSFERKCPLNRIEENQETFRRVFGTKSFAKEILILECGLQGPGWYQVKAEDSKRNISWCKSMCTITKRHSKAISQIKESAPNTVFSQAPRLRVLSLSIQTTKGKQRNDEIVCISTLLNEDVRLDGFTDENNVVARHMVCKMRGQNQWPYDWAEEIKKSSNIEHCANERMMLNKFTVNLLNWDPDVIVGHNLFSFTMEVLMTRLKAFKVPQWSRIGRLRRSQDAIPRKRYLKRGAGCGRLMCDTFTSAQEFLYGQKNYSLTALAKTQLNKKYEVLDVNKIPELWDRSKSIMEVVRHVEEQTRLSMQLLFKLQILPLTRQLTCLCGNLWQESLFSQRAQRNEYLLLHRFTEKGYIVPEKYTMQEKEELGIIPKQQKQTGRRKKAEYAGGLVLEPKSGFYDSYILLLDFNSLYPSIIQEYNLCFASVPHWHGMLTEAQVQVVFDDNPYGEKPTLLPEVITFLLTNRGKVKKQMKREKDPALKKSLNIKQLALKLVANSMYGCLGFSNSRFYCKPIAALITALGRKNLQKAASTTKSLYPHLDVIYGDTDSIMVDTQVKSRAKDENETRKKVVEVRALAYKIKNELNRTYRKMFLELDDIFVRYLLLKKKKYASLVLQSKRNEKNMEVFSVKTEYKGIDLVRRDWAKISAEIGKHVLDSLLNCDDLEVAVTNIKTSLKDVYMKIQNNHFPLEKFQITKKLSKEPNEYKDGVKLPHVEAAKRMRKDGIPAKVGDFIEYVVAEGTGAEHTRCYHIDQIRAKNLKLDMEYYLKRQIIPPICRLIDPVEGITAPMIGECFGVSISESKYSSKSSGSGGLSLADIAEEEEAVIRWANEKEKYEKCEPVKLKCIHCKTTLPYLGVLHPKTRLIGFKCPKVACKGFVSVETKQRDLNYYKNQLTRHFRRYAPKYLNRRYKCQQGFKADCPFQKPAPFVKLRHGRRCPDPCGGLTCSSFPVEKLYLAVDHLEHLFDVESAQQQLSQELKDAKQPDKSIKAMYAQANIETDTLKELKMHAQTLRRAGSECGMTYVKVNMQDLIGRFAFGVSA